ncbi:SirB2 family protein [Microbulbifer sp. OS29]|uniref:SirB2 family protein n=1 Tax=Microbulbifer okhotskensis TaxID=2926617 RepID=A0A9X2EPQ5_9GAMM|nr:SirB2 family protein [Microbulbifer okhotskensis]MCO1335529.1 SirB2 family protein [Microbulbifer okhotskensis]
MINYVLIKHIHITAAALSILLFSIRVGLELSHNTNWRKGPLRWVPHLNDTLLLSAAVGLVILGSWNPGTSHWLTVKLFLVFGYIVAGVFALRPNLSKKTRVTACALALLQVIAIFYLAVHKPSL